MTVVTTAELYFAQDIIAFKLQIGVPLIFQAGRSFSSYKCTSGQCDINSRSWKSCQGCRFKRCVEFAGMKEAKVAKLKKTEMVSLYSENGRRISLIVLKYVKSLLSPNVQ